MRLKYVKGNLLDHLEIGPIAHGVNAQGKMASGVAKEIRACFPQHFDDYHEHLDNYSEIFNFNVLGSVFETKTPLYPIYGIVTQKYYGYDSKRYVNYAAIAEGFSTIDSYLFDPDEDVAELGIPKIGAGLGGGDWNIISQIIEDATPRINVTVYELE